jgi:hypothetical protein
VSLYENVRKSPYRFPSPVEDPAFFVAGVGEGVYIYNTIFHGSRWKKPSWEIILEIDGMGHLAVDLIFEK